MKHLLSIESLSRAEILRILDLAVEMKRTRGQHAAHPLRHQCWALLFSKSSTRTRLSFEVGIRELGGDPLFLSTNDIQLGRGEPIEDTARVFGRMLHGVVIRTYAQSEIETFATASELPTVNALTDQEHPCQILADLFTIREHLGDFQDKTICFVGDGSCNVANSWMWAATRLGFQLKIAAPKQFQPAPSLLERLENVTCSADRAQAVRGADVLYTDVWISMGKESEAQERIAALGDYQVNDTLVQLAGPSALVMHCLPAYRGKEISAEVFERHAQLIFDQAENRLHVQKAILSLLER